MQEYIQLAEDQDKLFFAKYLICVIHTYIKRLLSENTAFSFVNVLYFQYV